MSTLQTIGIGANPDDGTGDTARAAGQKINDNFAALNTDKAEKISPEFTGDVTIADRIVHAGDVDTAIRFPSADTVVIETAGSDRFRVGSNGRVAIGGATGSELLTVRGSMQTLGGIFINAGLSGQTAISAQGKMTLSANAGFGPQFEFTNTQSGGNTWYMGHVWGATEWGLRDITANQFRFIIDGSGNVGIGLTPSFTARLHVGGPIRHATYTVATLPAAGTVGVGTRAMVTDSTSATFGNTVTGGGTTPVPVYSDGSVWRIG